MTYLEVAQKAIASLVEEDRRADKTLADLKVLRDDIEDRIWTLKLATGIGLWKDNPK